MRSGYGAPSFRMPSSGEVLIWVGHSTSTKQVYVTEKIRLKVAAAVAAPPRPPPPPPPPPPPQPPYPPFAARRNANGYLTIEPTEFKDKLEAGFFGAIIDVRSSREWDVGHIPDATLLAGFNVGGFSTAGASCASLLSPLLIPGRHSHARPPCAQARSRLKAASDVRFSSTATRALGPR